MPIKNASKKIATQNKTGTTMSTNVNLGKEVSIESLAIENQQRRVMTEYTMRKSAEVDSPAYSYFKDVPKHPFTDKLATIERLSFQGLEVFQIAARLGVSERVLSDACKRFPDLQAALVGGRARAADFLSLEGMISATNGDSGMLKFMLERKHRFVAPKDNPTVSVTINPAAEPPAISSADSMIENQQQLFKDMSFENEMSKIVEKSDSDETPKKE